MDIFGTLDNFYIEINKARDFYNEKEQDRIKWCRENKVFIKNLLPVKDEIREIIDISKLGFRAKDLYDDVYYFKTTTSLFKPTQCFSNGKYPQVDGDILDCNLKVVGHHFDCCITNMKKIEGNSSIDSQRNRITKVYVMIDKNTGYYKIGRSNNPIHREKTLQSEKPTIEMLHNFIATVQCEKVLHDMFSDKRIRGEWFDLSGSDIEKVKSYFGASSNT